MTCPSPFCSGAAPSFFNPGRSPLMIRPIKDLSLIFLVLEKVEAPCPLRSRADDFPLFSPIRHSHPPFSLLLSAVRLHPPYQEERRRTSFPLLRKSSSQRFFSASADAGHPSFLTKTTRSTTQFSFPENCETTFPLPVILRLFYFLSDPSLCCLCFLQRAGDGLDFL